MQVNLATSASGAVRAIQPTTPVRPQDGAGDRVEFRQADALQRALNQTPDIRPEAVARGRELFQQVPYPPAEIIQGLSRLLANEWPQTPA